MPRLTETRATRAKLPQTGQAFEWCSEIGGFDCRLMASGVRSWVVQLRYGGKVHRITLGKVGVLPFEGPPDHPGASDWPALPLRRPGAMRTRELPSVVLRIRAA